MFTSVACGPQGSSQEKEKNIDELKAEIAKLNSQVELIQKQVNDIHEIAVASQKPKSRKLPNQVNFDADGTLPSLGDDTADIAIIEFSDFQCPYCKRYLDQTFPLLSKNYIEQGKVKYLIRDFPLSFHPKAQGAAIAGICAQQQGSYWPFRDNLFNNMNKLEDSYYLQLSQELQLDKPLFEQCLSETTHLAKIQTDVALGKSLGVTGTPAFIVGKVENNVLVEPQLIIGAQSYRSFSIILNELAAPQ
ncbi:thioredoxin domain-containing protein [Thalassotalea psychrophila]|uniref:Thioredoxin domain-containing protein n=1 Tax=Thalassotalea psychrophila TaxID=3065647 RepID=A0ABY9TX56_9GAMM|nr:thioredoxin domain-containing protein [Colwelliaceae bacterium SQ149]